MRILSLLIILLSFPLHAEMVRMFKVTDINYDQDKKNYRVIFLNQAGVYRASSDTIVACLKKSLTEKKKVEVAFNPMGLLISACIEK